MEVCADGSGENDSHIINLMGSSDLNLVDTSMLPSDPRAMMDFVRSGEHDEDSISAATFHSTFQSLQNNSFPGNDNMTYSSTPTPPLSSLTCSVSLSASTISPIEMRNNSPIQISPPISHSSTAMSQVLSTNNLLIPHPRQSYSIMQQLHPLSSPPNPPSRMSPPYHQDVSSPPLDSRYHHQDIASSPLDSRYHHPDVSSPPMDARYHQDVSSPPLDTSRESHVSQQTPSPNQSMPPLLQTSPLHHQDYQTPYYSSSQVSPSSLSISKNFPNLGNIYSSNGGYTYATNAPLPQQTLAVANSIFGRKRTTRPLPIPQLKREPEDFSLGSSKLQHALSPTGLEPFGHLNIASDDGGEGSSNGHLSQRHSSGDTISVSSLISPLRSPSCNNSIASCSTPSDINNIGSRYTQGYIYSNSNSGQMLLETNSPRMQNSSQLQGHHQQNLFQPIHLHNPSGSQQQSSQLHQDDTHILPHSLSISLSAYEESLHNNDPLNSASRNLSLNYGDITLATTQSQPGLVYQQILIPSKMIGKEPRRRPSSSSSVRCRGNEENLDSYTTSSDEKDSEDDSLIIDTGKSPVEGYECGECKTVCRTRGNLRKHLASEHNTNEPEPAETGFKEYKCPVNGCPYITRYRNEHDDHVSEHVSQGWTPTGKKRQSKNPLLRHRYNKEEFRCPHCDYSCTVEKAFNKHLQNHENPVVEANLYEANFVSCVICGKDRPSELALRQHMNKHKRDKKYKCDICNFVTVQLKKLIQHRRMHTGEKPHLCPYCVYRAARRDNLRSHVRRMHKKDNMYCDTFTPRPLIKAQVGASHAASLHGMQHQLNQPHPLMVLDQHSNTQQSQIPQLQQQSLIDRLQQQQMIRQNCVPGISQQSVLSSQVHVNGMPNQDHNGLTQGLSLPQQSQHSLMSSPPGQ